MIVTVVAFVVVSIVAVGGGWFLGHFLAPKKQAAEQAAAVHIEHDKRKQEDAEKKQEISTPANGVVTLEPMTTNLAYPSETWIRLEVALHFRDQPDVATAEAIHQDLMAYLHTLSLQEIAGARGFANLRADLLHRAELRSRGRVDQLLFRTFVIE